MSTISDALAAIKTRVSTTLSSHKQLAFPSDVARNTHGALKLGYGIDVGPGINTQQVLSCKMLIERNISVIITRQVHAGTLDIDTKDAADKLLLEDQYLLLLDFESDPDLSGLVAHCIFDSDNGLEFVYDDEENFIKMEMVFRLKYLEDLT